MQRQIDFLSKLRYGYTDPDEVRDPATGFSTSDVGNKMKMFHLTLTTSLKMLNTHIGMGDWWKNKKKQSWADLVFCACPQRWNLGKDTPVAPMTVENILKCLIPTFGNCDSMIIVKANPFEVVLSFQFPEQITKEEDDPVILLLLFRLAEPEQILNNPKLKKFSEFMESGELAAFTSLAFTDAEMNTIALSKEDRKKYQAILPHLKLYYLDYGFTLQNNVFKQGTIC